MKLEALTLFFALFATAHAHDNSGVFGRHHAHIAKRQGNVAAAAVTSSFTSSSASSSSTASAAATSSSTASAAAATTSASVAGATVTSAPAASTSLGYDPNSIPPLSDISFGMATGTTYAAAQTYTAGATPTALPGAPPLPTPFVFNAADWPTADVIPPTDSDEVQAWMNELDGFYIPDIRPTVDGSCVNDTQAAADAEQNGWWTCGGWTAPTDRTDCNDKLTWGVSFDDGPAPYTQEIINYLNTINHTATFYVVGSRIIERPQLLVEEYMQGHEIAVHTWSHHPLTAMTNEQIVAELGWCRKAIKDVIGVTPTTFRPPYGDVDNRVRAIAMAMGLEVSLWTTYHGFAFDTFDWKVAGGTVSAPQQMAQFESILGNATELSRGFVVLEHDLYEITVDLAVGYTLPLALTYNPPFNLERVGQCNGIPLTNMYLETTTNTTFPYRNTTDTPSNTTSSGGSSSGGSSGGSATGSSGAKGAASSNSSGASRSLSLSTSMVGSVVGAGVLTLAALFL